jgi:hypothetical protein
LVDGFTSGMKSHLMAYLLGGSAHIYWIRDLEGEVHASGLQECKSNGFFCFKAGRAVVYRQV